MSSPTTLAAAFLAVFLAACSPRGAPVAARLGVARDPSVEVGSRVSEVACSRDGLVLVGGWHRVVAFVPGVDSPVAVLELGRDDGVRALGARRSDDIVVVTTAGAVLHLDLREGRVREELAPLPPGFVNVAALVDVRHELTPAHFVLDRLELEEPPLRFHALDRASPLSYVAAVAEGAHWRAPGRSRRDCPRRHRERSHGSWVTSSRPNSKATIPRSASRVTARVARSRSIRTEARACGDGFVLYDEHAFMLVDRDLHAWGPIDLAASLHR